MPGWPVRSDRFPYHDGSHAFSSGELPKNLGGTVVGGLAAGDLNHDGTLEVLAADYEGNVYAWDQHGNRVFHETSNINYQIGRDTAGMVISALERMPTAEKGRFLAIGMDVRDDASVVAAHFDEIAKCAEQDERPVQPLNRRFVLRSFQRAAKLLKQTK